jgi:hypothetical protein
MALIVFLIPSESRAAMEFNRPIRATDASSKDTKGVK